MPKHGMCIFCGGTSLSAEHVWPKWISKAVPSKSTHSYHRSIEAVRVYPNPQYQVSAIVRGGQTRPGALISRRLRVVCKTCNNEWMSIIQKDAQPLLMEIMINRNYVITNNKDRTIVLRWIIMFGIVAEYLNPDRVTTSQAERRLFFESKNPLINWAAWIGFYKDEILDATGARHGQIHHIAIGKIRFLGEEWQIGVSTAICGGLILQTVNTRLEQTKLDVQDWAKKNRLALLHPALSFTPKTIKTFNDEECSDLHNNLVKASMQSRSPFQPSIKS